MGTISFDRQKFASTLKEAGVPDKQAEAEARAVADAFAVNASELATKADLRAEITRLDNKLDSLRAEMQSRFESLEMLLTMKPVALMVVAVGIIATLMKH